MCSSSSKVVAVASVILVVANLTVSLFLVCTAVNAAVDEWSL